MIAFAYRVWLAGSAVLALLFVVSGDWSMLVVSLLLGAAPSICESLLRSRLPFKVGDIVQDIQDERLIRTVVRLGWPHDSNDQRYLYYHRNNGSVNGEPIWYWVKYTPPRGPW